jgi:hypothetical protein
MMEAGPQTKGARHIETLMQELPKDSERYQVLASAKQFKSSWIELGEWLVRVSRNRQYQNWGYSSFEEYCSKEIRIRRQTAEKLLLAFRFLERREPALLEAKHDRPLPDYRSIDLLRQADEEQHFRPDDYANLRATIIEEDRSLPTAVKQYRDMMQSYQQGQQSKMRCKAALIAAKRLSTSLTALDAVPAEMDQSVAALIRYLESRLEDAPVSDSTT